MVWNARQGLRWTFGGKGLVMFIDGLRVCQGGDWTGKCCRI